MRSLRIILVLIEPPIPFGSPTARWSYVLLKSLVERGHRVTALATCSKIDDIDQAKTLFPKEEYDLRCYPHTKRYGFTAKIETLRKPYSYIFSPELKRDLISELTKPYDILHLEHLWSGWLGLQYCKRAVINIHYLFSLDQVFSYSNTIESKFRQFTTYGAEQKLIKAFSRIITLSDRLAQQISKINPNAEIHVIPLGIDLSLYPFINQKSINKRPVLGLIGGFDWAPSYSAAIRLLTQLWPEIKRRVPNIRLQIVGRSAKNKLSEFAHLPDLEIHQDVPDIIPYFKNIDVLLYAPIAGSGMKVKIMEAFALGTSVVTTSEGIEGLMIIRG
jgi:polysaccharide biosynthesis protein PslH